MNFKRLVGILKTKNFDKYCELFFCQRFSAMFIIYFMRLKIAFDKFKQAGMTIVYIAFKLKQN